MTFVADMGPRPDGTTLERKDNSKDYSPENCCWATAKQQTLNRSVTHWLTLNGVTLCLTDWARIVGLWPKTILSRIRSGWTIDEALLIPSQTTKGKGPK